MTHGRARRLGVLGGTFNPIHYGHLFLAAEAQATFRLHRVLFIPNGLPPHKQLSLVASASDRLEMAARAIRPNRRFALSSIEIDRPGPSYTIETLESLKAAYPDDELYYIAGADAAADLQSWHRHGDVIRTARIIAAARDGCDFAQLKDRLPQAYLQQVDLMYTSTLNISSTAIRARLSHGEPVRYLLPDSVITYIRTNGLYCLKADSPPGATV